MTTPTTQAVQNLPELPPFSQLVHHMLRDYVPSTVELQVAAAIRQYAKSYALSAISSHEAEVGRLRKLLETVQATLPHMGGNSMSTHNLLKDIGAALTQGETK